MPELSRFYGIVIRTSPPWSRQKRVVVRRVAGPSRLVGGDIGLENLENVDVSALLGRPAVELDPARVTASLQARVVLVTGAGGSSGSALCRQISRCRPARARVATCASWTWASR
ncbi:MAG: polysaccharide biosynthesis protein [Candidatus Latescibacterota bacterium]